jgi:hypothetical protein
MRRLAISFEVHVQNAFDFSDTKSKEGGLQQAVQEVFFLSFFPVEALVRFGSIHNHSTPSLRDVSMATNDAGGQSFNPSLWRQRRAFILRILREHAVSSVKMGSTMKDYMTTSALTMLIGVGLWLWRRCIVVSADASKLCGQHYSIDWPRPVQYSVGPLC